MARELCILFMHHRDDALTRLHLEKVRGANPEAVVVPLCDRPASAVPGAIDVSGFASEWDTRDLWRACDTMIYRWFPNRTVSAKKYLVLEYDCWCDVDVREYYREHWEADVVARSHPIAGLSDWPWFAEVPKLAPEDQPFAAGIYPIAGTMLSHDALERVCAVVSRADVLSELRLGTAVRRAGLHVRTLTGVKKERIQYLELAGRIEGPGLYHAVKSIDHNSTRSLAKVRTRVRSLVSIEARAAVVGWVERAPSILRWWRSR